MLRKILAIAFVAAMLFSFGCKKKETAPTTTIETPKVEMPADVNVK